MDQLFGLQHRSGTVPVILIKIVSFLMAKIAISHNGDNWKDMNYFSILQTFHKKSADSRSHPHSV